jgi:hypothetical protein
MYKAGFRSQSANPWKVDDYQKVLAHVQGRLDAATGIERVVLARDAFAMSIGWHLFTRGKTVLDWHLQHLETEDGECSLYISACMLLLCATRAKRFDSHMLSLT